MVTAALLAAMFVVMHVALTSIARYVESTTEVYPFKFEGRLRYLLPTLWPASGKLLLLLSGASTTREGLEEEQFALAFPEHRVYQGAFSLGTLADAMASLEYIERVYGAGALPRVLVLGMSQRALAELPHDRPFANSLNEYSPYLKVPGSTLGGFGLAPKSRLEGQLDHIKFLLFKQRARYRTALVWLGARFMGPERSAAISRTPAVSKIATSAMLRETSMGRALRKGMYQAALEYVDPHYLHDEAPQSAETVEHEFDMSTLWRRVFRWNPYADSAALRHRVNALRGFVDERGIDLYVVNLPERSLLRDRYPLAYRRGYDALLRSLFAGVPMIDLRCGLRDDQFYDGEHPIEDGARLESHFVIEFMRAEHAARSAAPSETLAARRRVRTLAEEHRCQ